MSNTSDVAINKDMAPLLMAEIQAENEQFLSQMEGEYEELANSFSVSEGEFIDALKAQIKAELEVIRAASSFFQTLVQMMQAADSDFGALDNAYAQEKIK